MPRATFLQLWQRSQVADQLANDAAAAVANYVDDADRHAIEDLTDPLGKRFLFDGPRKVAQESTSVRRPPSRPSLRPLRANELPVVSRSLRACLPGCTCPCVRCALMCERARACTQERTNP
jgi:hypothetical protein